MEIFYNPRKERKNRKKDELWPEMLPQVLESSVMSIGTVGEENTVQKVKRNSHKTTLW